MASLELFLGALLSSSSSDESAGELFTLTMGLLWSVRTASFTVLCSSWSLFKTSRLAKCSRPRAHISMSSASLAENRLLVEELPRRDLGSLWISLAVLRMSERISAKSSSWLLCESSCCVQTRGQHKELELVSELKRRQKSTHVEINGRQSSRKASAAAFHLTYCIPNSRSLFLRHVSECGDPDQCDVFIEAHFLGDRTTAQWSWVACPA